MLKNLRQSFFVLVALMMALFSAASHATVDSAITTAISGASSDLVTIGTAIVVAMVAFWGVKAIGRKMGWWT